MNVNSVVVNMSGTRVSFKTAVEHMDDCLREFLHEELYPCTEQEFFTAYERAYYERFHRLWFLSEKNPVW